LSHAAKAFLELVKGG
jgi:hypothetical protein